MNYNHGDYFFIGFLVTVLFFLTLLFALAVYQSGVSMVVVSVLVLVLVISYPVGRVILERGW